MKTSNHTNASESRGRWSPAQVGECSFSAVSCRFRFVTSQPRLARSLSNGENIVKLTFCEEIRLKKKFKSQSSSQDSNEIHFRVKMPTNRGKLKKSYAEKVGVTVSSLRFLFDGSKNKPAIFYKDFAAQIIVLNHHGQICNGYSPILDCHTAHIDCKFNEFGGKVSEMWRHN